MVTIKKLGSDILREIGTLSRSIHSISDLRFKELKLQKGQFTFLTRICENQGISLVNLSDLLKVDKTTTTKAIQKLIEAGYIDKKRDDFDKRIWRLFPREKALEIYSFIIDEENRNIEICFADMSAEEKILVRKLIKKMSGNIEKSWSDLVKNKNDLGGSI